jgi:hypothetical protein
VATAGFAGIDAAVVIVGHHGVINPAALVWGIERYGRQVPDVIVIESVLLGFGRFAAASFVAVHFSFLS